MPNKKNATSGELVAQGESKAGVNMLVSESHSTTNGAEHNQNSNYSIVPNGIIRHFGREGDYTGLEVWMALNSFCRWGESLSSERECFPSQATIAEMTGFGRRNIPTIIKRLEKSGLIRVERHSVGKRGRGVNHYYLQPVDGDGNVIAPTEGRLATASQPTEVDLPPQVNGRLATTGMNREPVGIESHKYLNKEPSSSSSYPSAQSQKEEEDGSLSFQDSDTVKEKTPPPQNGMVENCTPTLVSGRDDSADSPSPVPDNPSPELDAAIAEYEKHLGKRSKTAEREFSGLVDNVGWKAVIRGTKPVAAIVKERGNTDKPIRDRWRYFAAYVRDNAAELDSGSNGRRKYKEEFNGDLYVLVSAVEGDGIFEEPRPAAYATFNGSER